MAFHIVLQCLSSHLLNDVFNLEKTSETSLVVN